MTRLLALPIALLLSAISFSSATRAGGEVDLKASSVYGQHILANAIQVDSDGKPLKNRKLEESNFADYDSIVNYSIKYVGCFRWFEWNDEANGDEDIRLSAKRVVNFKLCPADSCSKNSVDGCSSNYGDYIVDMSLFLESYFGVMKEQSRYENGDDGGYNYYMEYATCNEFNNYNNNNYNRELNYYDVLEDSIYAYDYFLGPYCTDAGISVGLFTDDTCTMVAGGGESTSDNDGASVYEQLTNGEKLPFSEESMIQDDCIPCEVEGEEGQMNEFCEELYDNSGKCEAKMKFSYKDNSSCKYIAGLPTLKYGFYESGGSSTTATVFIVFFAFTCAGLGAYVWYLWQKAHPKTTYFYD